MDTNLVVQYSLVGLCLLGAIIWMIRKASKRSKNGGCYGCSMSETCASARIVRQHKRRKKQMRTADSKASGRCPKCGHGKPEQGC